MAQTESKDKPVEPPRRVETPAEDEEELARELVEAVASAYFATCRRLAKLLNRKS